MRFNVSLKLRYFCRQQQSRFPSLHKCFAYLKIISILKLITQALPLYLKLQECFPHVLYNLFCVCIVVCLKRVWVYYVYFLKLSPTFLSCFPFTIPNKRSPYPAKRMQCYIRLLRLGRPKNSYCVAKTNHWVIISVNCSDILFY